MRSVIWGMLGVLVLAVCTAQAAVKVWDNDDATGLASADNNWSGNTKPVSGDDIRLDGTSTDALTWDLTSVSPASWTQTVAYVGTVTIQTKYTGFTNLHITGDCEINGGAWTHPPNSGGATAVDRLSVTVDGDFALAAGAEIDVEGKGFAGNQGPGFPGVRMGASHGGEAGINYEVADQAPEPYGSVKAPTTLGSGANHADRPGGGAVWLSVGGLTTLDGTINADGSQTGYTFSGGGSGGSIFLITGSLSGSGTNRADGATCSGRGAGGGGRIAVKLESGSTFGSVRMLARGGLVGTSPSGASGTIYLEIPGDSGAGTLVIDNNGYGRTQTPSITLMPRDTPVNLNTDFGEIVITNKGALGVNSNTTLNLGTITSLTVHGAGQSELSVVHHDLLTLPASLSVSNYTLALSEPDTLTGSVLVQNGGVLSSVQNASTDDHVLDLTIGGNLTVESGGAIDLDGRGYWVNQGPGQPPVADSHGGTHAGQGGSRNAPRAPGSTYGSVVNPVTAGSAGNNANGGGIARLDVSGQTTIEAGARISAAGLHGGHYGGGAGGSIFLTTDTLVGDGEIDCRGGDGSSRSGGGGGRIAVKLGSGTDFDSVTMRAYGGTVPGTPNNEGAAGTVYTETSAQSGGRGNVTIDNIDNTVLMNTNVTWFPPQQNVTATISNELQQATVTLTNNAWLRLSGDARFGDLYLPDSDSILDLNSMTLYIDTKEHPLGPGAATNYGEIRWRPPTGSVIIFR